MLFRLITLLRYLTLGKKVPNGYRLAGGTNDPLNLLAVDASTNQQKGDGDAATWLPPNKPYVSIYQPADISQKIFGLWVTEGQSQP